MRKGKTHKIVRIQRRRDGFLDGKVTGGYFKIWFKWIRARSWGLFLSWCG